MLNHNLVERAGAAHDDAVCVRARTLCQYLGPGLMKTRTRTGVRMAGTPEALKADPAPAPAGGKLSLADQIDWDMAQYQAILKKYGKHTLLRPPRAASPCCQPERAPPTRVCGGGVAQTKFAARTRTDRVRGSVRARGVRPPPCFFFSRAYAP